MTMEKPQNSIFVQEINEDFLCGICYQVLESPESACDQGSHIFCRACLTKVVSTAGQASSSAKCPLCRAKLRRTPVANLERAIQKLEVRCSSSGDGCSWKGQLSSHASHQELCPHKMIQCPFRSTAGCKWEGRRRSITDHLVSEVQDHATAALAQIKDLRSQLELAQAAQPPTVTEAQLRAWAFSPPSSPLSLGGADATSEALRSGIQTPSMSSPSSNGLVAVPAANIPSSLHAGTISWVPCPMVKVQVKAHNQFWPRRKGFVTETMGRECKVDLLSQCLDSVLYPPVTVVLDGDDLEASRPTRGDNVVIIDMADQHWGVKGTLVGIINGEAITRIGTVAAGDDVVVLSLSAVAALHQPVR